MSFVAKVIGIVLGTAIVVAAILYLQIAVTSVEAEIERTASPFTFGHPSHTCKYPYIARDALVSDKISSVFVGKIVETGIGANPNGAKVAHWLRIEPAAIFKGIWSTDQQLFYRKLESDRGRLKGEYLLAIVGEKANLANWCDSSFFLFADLNDPDLQLAMSELRKHPDFLVWKTTRHLELLRQGRPINWIEYDQPPISEPPRLFGQIETVSSRKPSANTTPTETGCTDRSDASPMNTQSASSVLIEEIKAQSVRPHAKPDAGIFCSF